MRRSTLRRVPTPENIAEFVTAYLARVVNRRDVSAVDDMVAPEYSGSGHGWPQTLTELRAFYDWQASTRPDWYIDVQETVAVGNCVVVRAEASGTVTEDERGRPLAAPAASHVEWLSAYWVSDDRIRQIQVLSLASRDE